MGDYRAASERLLRALRAVAVIGVVSGCGTSADPSPRVSSVTAANEPSPPAASPQTEVAEPTLGEVAESPSPPIITEMSLPPATQAAAPEPVPSLQAMPSVVLPPTAPADSPSVAAPDYDRPAADLVGFIAGYRAAYPGLTWSDAEIEGAGARLCTYLARNADLNGVVDPETVIADADLSEPGYARSDWAVAFDLALTYYCTEFSGNFAAGG